MKNELKITERGWAGHFIGATSCKFRRNTLIEYGRKKIVVSTVGVFCPLGYGKPQSIGAGDRYYETMAFKAKFIDPYWDADVTRDVRFGSNWALGKIGFDTDKEANEMHEAVVKELSETIQK